MKRNWFLFIFYMREDVQNVMFCNEKLTFLRLQVVLFMLNESNLWKMVF